MLIGRIELIDTIISHARHVTGRARDLIANAAVDGDPVRHPLIPEALGTLGGGVMRLNHSRTMNLGVWRPRPVGWLVDNLPVNREERRTWFVDC